MGAFSAGRLNSQDELKLERKDEGNLRKLPSELHAVGATLLGMVDQFTGFLDQREMRKKLHPRDRRSSKPRCE